MSMVGKGFPTGNGIKSISTAKGKFSLPSSKNWRSNRVQIGDTAQRSEPVIPPSARTNRRMTGPISFMFERLNIGNL